MRLKRAALAGGLIAVVTATAAVTTLAAYADEPPVSPMIVGGQEVSSAPWAAQVDSGTGLCSGTIISARWVLTAAHCVDQATVTNYKVYVGDVKLNAGTMAKVKRAETRFDLAVLELDRDVDATYAKLAETDPAVDSTVDIYGWGGTCEQNCGVSEILKTARLRVDEILSVDGNKIVLLNQIGGGYAWQGDSGGPAMLNGVQFGVLCCGNTLGDGSGREWYTSVANSLGWITSVTGVGGGPSDPPPGTGTRLIGYADKCMDVDGGVRTPPDRTKVHLWDCHDNANQKWDFQPDGSVRSLGKCLDVAWADPDNGSGIQVVSCSGNDAQKFTLGGDGLLRTRLDGNRCVDVDGWNGDNGARIQLWDCHGGANQKWRRG